MPETEEEIASVVTSGALEEGPTFDAKKEMSSNKETAKDIAAMANDGGVIIYGIAEDESGRPTVLNPIPFSGQRERLESIARTAIQEPIPVKTWTISTAADPALGYVVLVIPPSDRAPHMVGVKTNRFYGRAGTSNIPLEEGEVARLYARRQQTEVDMNKLLEQVLELAPLPPKEGFAYLHVVVQPVLRREGLIASAPHEGEKMLGVLKDLVQVVQPATVARLVTPDFYHSRWRHDFDGYVVDLDKPDDPNNHNAPRHTLRMYVGTDGTARLFSGGAGFSNQELGFLLAPTTLASNMIRFLILLSNLYERASYFGSVDIGVAVTGIKGARLPAKWEYLDLLMPYERDHYQRSRRLSTLLLGKDVQKIVEELFMPLVATGMRRGRFDLFSGAISPL